jgi:hypothetical protein
MKQLPQPENSGKDERTLVSTIVISSTQVLKDNKIIMKHVIKKLSILKLLLQFKSNEKPRINLREKSNIAD